jgi:ABC transporter with metal-binding/Fe-S-binding domain ATP-binding protein
MKVAVLFSGGKDSCLAMYKAMQTGHEVACLISLISKNPESYMFHVPNIKFTKAQAEVIGLPLIQFTTKGEKEKELEDLKNAIIEAKKKFHIEGIVTGALYSEYQASRIQKICADLGLKCVNPLWHSNPEKHWEEILDNGFKVIISGIAAEGLGKEWLGKVINKNSFNELKELSKKFQFSLVFEGGEAETTVLFGPFFKKKLKIIKAKKIMESKYVGQFIIERIKLI